MPWLYRLTGNDRRLILSILAVAIAALAGLALLRPHPRARVALKVKTSTGDYGPYYLSAYSQPTMLEFSGPVGKSVLEISSTGVRMVRSDCPDKVCIGMGTISKPGESIICLPNMVFARIVEVQ